MLPGLLPPPGATDTALSYTKFAVLRGSPSRVCVPAHAHVHAVTRERLGPRFRRGGAEPPTAGTALFLNVKIQRG